MQKSKVSFTKTKNNEFDLYYKGPTTHRKPTLACTLFWNQLPTEIKSIKSSQSYKAILKDYLISLWCIENRILITME